MKQEVWQDSSNNEKSVVSAYLQNRHDYLCIYIVNQLIKNIILLNTPQYLGVIFLFKLCFCLISDFEDLFDDDDLK